MKTTKIKIKSIYFVILGIVFTIVLCSIFWALYKKGEHQTIIIPNNYEGGVIVLCNAENGNQKIYINKQRIFDIPNNGILKTKFKLQNGKRYNIKYFYESGIELRYLYPSDKIWKDTINPNSVFKDSIYVYHLGYANDFWFIVGKPKDIGKHNRKLDIMWAPFSKKRILKQGDSYDTKTNLN